MEFVGEVQVHIQFECELPCCKLPAEKNPLISGVVCSTLELAETSAIMKAFEHLDYMHNVEVVDLSTHKIALLKIRSRTKYMKLLDGISCVENMLTQWSACCDLFYCLQQCPFWSIRSS